MNACKSAIYVYEKDFSLELKYFPFAQTPSLTDLQKYEPEFGKEILQANIQHRSCKNPRN